MIGSENRMPVEIRRNEYPWSVHINLINGSNVLLLLLLVVVFNMNSHWIGRQFCGMYNPSLLRVFHNFESHPCVALADNSEFFEFVMNNCKLLSLSVYSTIRTINLLKSLLYLK